MNVRVSMAFLLSLSIAFTAGCNDKPPEKIVATPKVTKIQQKTVEIPVEKPVENPIQTIAEKPIAGKSFLNGHGIEMKWIPPGSFEMGKGTNHSAERPVHEVTLKSGFWMSATEVTQEQYEKVMGQNPSKLKGTKHPVESVDWSGANRFCNKLQALEWKMKRTSLQYVYKLPSEAQWEYCCRGGTEGPRYNESVDEIAWHEGNAGKTHHEVGLKKANRFGLYDMLGNVSEWCADGFHRSYEGAPADGSAWVKGMVKGDYVTRGGHYDANGHFCSAYFRRFFWQVNAKLPFNGFRIVLVPRKWK